MSGRCSESIVYILNEPLQSSNMARFDGKLWQSPPDDPTVRGPLAWIDFHYNIVDPRVVSAFNGFIRDYCDKTNVLPMEKTLLPNSRLDSVSETMMLYFNNMLAALAKHKDIPVGPSPSFTPVKPSPSQPDVPDEPPVEPDTPATNNSGPPPPPPPPPAPVPHTPKGGDTPAKKPSPGGGGGGPVTLTPDQLNKKNLKPVGVVYSKTIPFYFVVSDSTLREAAWLRFNDMLNKPIKGIESYKFVMEDTPAQKAEREAQRKKEEEENGNSAADWDALFGPPLPGTTTVCPLVLVFVPRGSPPRPEVEKFMEDVKKNGTETYGATDNVVLVQVGSSTWIEEETETTNLLTVSGTAKRKFIVHFSSVEADREKQKAIISEVVRFVLNKRKSFSPELTQIPHGKKKDEKKKKKTKK